MNRINSISFTGLKNIGGSSLIVENDKGRKLVHKYLLVNLTDDRFGKDYTEFREAVKRCNGTAGACIFPLDKNFLHIATVRPEVGNQPPQLFVNHDLIPTQDETMSLFSYIAKLTKRIANMDEKDFVVNQDFKYGPDADEYIIPNKTVSEVVPPEYRELFIENFFAPETSKYTAGTINDDIQTQMLDYFS